MHIFYKNFLRSRTTNLSIKSVRHFMPKAKIVVCNLYNNDKSEYDQQEKIVDADEVFYLKTKYPKTNDIPLDASINSEKDKKGRYITSGYRNPNNSNFFTEGFNICYEYFINEHDKVIVLAEDHYFTNGETLKELNNNDWDFAFAPFGNHSSWINASILGFIPSKYSSVFPLPECTKVYPDYYVERHLSDVLFKKIDPSLKKYLIRNRKTLDYMGDGQYTNSSDVIEQHLKEAGII